ncbi:MAG: HAMP domain-containing protein [Bacteroidia bacterium]|nr:HAMP domain-containing protein [Bacteroidia bacterium]
MTFLTLSLKTKIFLVLLFFLITLSFISFLGYRYIQEFAGKSRSIMEDNYISVRYAAAMQVHLNQIHQFQVQSVMTVNRLGDKVFKPTSDYRRALLGFEAQLFAARKNMTERGERELFDSLENAYRNYLASFRKTFNASADKRSMEANIALANQEFFPLYNKLRAEIIQLQDINMEAILNKSRSIQETGNQVSFYLALFAMFSMIITLTLLVVMPGYLSNPIDELNEKIKQIIDENYDQKLELKYHSGDEVGELATSFNLMASKLKHYEESNLSQVWFEKKRTETVIQMLKRSHSDSG